MGYWVVPLPCNLLSRARARVEDQPAHYQDRDLARTARNARQEIGFTHMRVLEGVSTIVQLGGLIARLCKLGMKPEVFQLPKP